MRCARELTDALGGRWRETYGTALCPAHEDRNPSLQIRDGHTAVLLRCYAGCETRDVIGALMVRGLWPVHGKSPSLIGRSYKPSQARSYDDTVERSGIARHQWTRAVAASGSLVETYLRSRGITVDIPPTIRFQPSTKQTDTGLWLPCMMAAVQRWPCREVVAVHRTFLKVDGSGKAAVSSPKKMLGPVAGGAVRLAPHGPKLVVVEGIETGLTILQEAGCPTWAALSKGGIERLILPAEVDEVTIAADNDEPGLEAAKRSAHRWTVEGRTVRIAKPPIVGWDYNDMLMSKNIAVFPRSAPCG